MTINNSHLRPVRLNHSNAIPRYIVAVDTETIPVAVDGNVRRFHHKFRLGVAQYARIRDLNATDRKTVSFDNAAIFWELLRQLTGSRHTTWVVGHNILFDLVTLGMPEKFEQGELVVDWPRSKRQRENNSEDNAHCFTYLVVDEPSTIIAAKMTSTQGRIVFLDTLNYFHCPLADLGLAIGKPKMKMPDFTESDETWFPYCARDTEIAFDTFLNLIRWVRDNNMGMFRYTAPSQAMSAYRHRFMEHTIFPHDVPQIRTIERAAFFGGRSECWKLGEIDQTVWQYDVTSFYPYVMMLGKFPVVLDKWEERDEPIELQPCIDWYQAAAVVELRTREPVFPVRTDKGVVYPIGTFYTTLCGAELGYAMRKRYVKKVGTWASYRCESIFNRWVCELWGMRRDCKASGDTTYDLFIKTLLNSLFGKFAQRRSSWENLRGEMPNLPWSSWYSIDKVLNKVQQYRSFGWQTQVQTDRDEIPGTFIAISAFVTAAGRILMNQYRKIIGGDNVLYQGVDSVIVNKKGMERLEASGLVSESELGKFRLQCTADSGVIYGAADYAVGERIIVAGRPKRQRDSDRETDLCRRMDVKGGLFGGGSTNYVPELLQEWRRVGGYWKGVPQQSGKVYPIIMGDLSNVK